VGTLKRYAVNIRPELKFKDFYDDEFDPDSEKVFGGTDRSIRSVQYARNNRPIEKF
jgi:hypothetical protein